MHTCNELVRKYHCHTRDEAASEQRAVITPCMHMHHQHGPTAIATAANLSILSPAYLVFVVATPQNNAGMVAEAPHLVPHLMCHVVQEGLLVPCVCVGRIACM